MPTYDLHQHLWPERLLAALAARGAPPRLRAGALELAGGSTLELDLAEIGRASCRERVYVLV